MNSLLDSWRISLGSGEQLSARSLQTLRWVGLESKYLTHPEQAFEHFQCLIGPTAPPEQVFALAEISFLLGQRAEKKNDATAYRYFYLSAGYAYHYIFGQLQSPGEVGRAMATTETVVKTLPVDCFDPRFRLACELYNASLAKCIQAGQQCGQLDPRQQLLLRTADGQDFCLTVVHHGFSWRPDEFGPMLFCADYAVVGLENHYRGFGLGVPLIGTRRASAPGPGQAFYAKEMSFPVTAFFRFEGDLCDLLSHKAGRLELYNPLVFQSVQVRDWTIPLETDLTTPLAYFLSRSDLEKVGYLGFLRGEKVMARAGIYLYEPYQPGKIPILFVHGLLSSPLTWAPMINDLQADPVLREKYQFWFYLYPTGNPYNVTAAELRKALNRLRGDIDPNHQDTALDQMVVVGHSMGGLVGKMLTVDSGDDFWRLASTRSIDDLKLTSEARDALESVFFFKRQPEVKRVIFVGTPHLGSQLSPSVVGRLGVKLIVLPSMLQSAFESAMQENAEFWQSPHSDRVPTSIDLLAPQAPALKLLADKPRPRGVHYHSIVGVLSEPPRSVRLLNYFFGDDQDTGDGVVPYHSAHLEGVASELVLSADHMTLHHHPQAMTEVRRILLEHLHSTASNHPQVLSLPGVLQPVAAHERMKDGKPE